MWYLCDWRIAHVSSRAAAGGRRPIIDLENQSLLAGLAKYSEVKIVASFERLLITPSIRAFAVQRSRTLQPPFRVLEVFAGGGTMTAGLFGDERFRVVGRLISRGTGAWFPGPHHAQGEPTPIVERFHSRLHFKHRITHRRQSVALVGCCEEFGFHDARPIREAEELHWFACDLVMGALLQDQSAGRMSGLARIRWIGGG